MGHQANLGNLGVQLFFVLSGFLITRILLSLKDRYVTGVTDRRQTLLSFFLRRAARIWPIYFLTLALVFAAGDRFEHRSDMIWHALFASNFLFFRRAEFGSTLSHFWTLAVEQQFYLLWPLLVLYVPQRHLEKVILVLILVAPLTRLALYTAGFTDFAQYNVLPLANFDSLGFGALVALWSRIPVMEANGRWRTLSLSAAAALLPLVAQTFVPLPANLAQTLYAVVFAWLIAGAREGFTGVVGRTLESVWKLTDGHFSAADCRPWRRVSWPRRHRSWLRSRARGDASGSSTRMCARPPSGAAELRSSFGGLIGG